MIGTNFFLKDFHGRWHTLQHHLNGQDHPPALEELYAVISELHSPWILYRGSNSPVPEYTEAYPGLLVEEVKEQQSQSNGAPCVEIKSQVYFSRLPNDINELCQTAYCLAERLTSSAAARRLEDILETTPTDLDDPVYREALQSLGHELKRLSRSIFAMEALAASGHSTDERGTPYIEDLIWRMYRGLYLQIEEYAPGNRKWCVD